jgi:parallel beta-helix repeat protein
MHKKIKVIMIISITIALLTPVYLVIADDLEPPVISNIIFTPHAGVRTDTGFSLYQSCNVTDNVSVADVRINITGPVGFTTINTSMIQTSSSGYHYELFDITLSGTYWFYIWAIDSSNNTARSANFHTIVLDSYLSYIYVDGNNTAGPWNGSAQYPLQYISDALSVLAENGTIYIHEGLYENSSFILDKNLNLVGETRDTTILDGGGNTTSYVLQITENHVVNITLLTLQNALIGLSAQNCSNSTIADCAFSHCYRSALDLNGTDHFFVSTCDIQDNNHGIQLTNSSANQFYHNNFINNTIHVSMDFNASSNVWDNGATGNYWDDYRSLYPYASVIPATGTWNTPYVVNISHNNTDYHPWVYPSGHIDTVPPQVTVLYPTGGEDLFGDVTIQWIASDDYTMDLNGSILIEYSMDNGNNWILLASNYNNTGMYVWNTTLVPNGDLNLISVSTIDEFYNVGSDTSDAPFSIANNWEPESLQILGPSIGANGITYNFTVVALDPEGEQIYYQLDWGDGNFTDWLGPVNSGVSITTPYAWASDGIYNITARVRDIEGSESNWSAPHMIIIQPLLEFSEYQLGYVYINLFTYNKSYIYSNFLERLRIVVLLTNHEMEVKANGAYMVDTVVFQAYNLRDDLTTILVDDNSSDGFRAVFNLTRAMYEINITAYDANGSFVDKCTLPTVFYFRIGRFANGPEEMRPLQRFASRFRH